MTGLFDVGDVLDLVASSFSGFTYDLRRTELPLIGNGTDAGNVVIQDSARGYRRAQLAIAVESDDDLETLRGYSETGETILLVDDADAIREVMVFGLAPAKVAAAGRWDVTLDLREVTPPPEGS